MFYHVTYKLSNSITGERQFDLIGIEADSFTDAEAAVTRIVPTLKTSFNYDEFKITEVMRPRDEREVGDHDDQ